MASKKPKAVTVWTWAMPSWNSADPPYLCWSAMCLTKKSLLEETLPPDDGYPIRVLITPVPTKRKRKEPRK